MRFSEQQINHVQSPNRNKKSNFTQALTSTLSKNMMLIQMQDDQFYFQTKKQSKINTSSSNSNSQKQIVKPIQNKDHVKVYTNLNSQNKTKQVTKHQSIYNFQQISQKYQKQQVKQPSIQQKVKQQYKNIFQTSDKLKYTLQFQDDEQESLQDNTDQPKQIKPMTFLYNEASDQQQSQSLTMVGKFDQYYHTSKFNKQVYTKINKNKRLQTQLQRNNSGLNNFWPQFSVKFRNQLPFLFAKRTSARPVSTFILSSKNNDFQQSSSNYLGKMKSNSFGDTIYIFGPGLNMQNAKQRKTQPRQMLATVVYNSTFFSSGKPRDFTVYVKKPQYNYHKDFVRDNNIEQGYNQLFNKQMNRQKIQVYQNRKPFYNNNIGGYVLDFSGRVAQTSVKNFILQDTYGRELVMFGKINENLFNFDISEGISLYVAFALVLSEFDTKVMCE